ncbi:putative heat shock protein [Leishmania major strain Friedlin]|uniref:Putative heat shock protein n=1 Tax=Leishmania major TaxID=5664 RepID=O97211_LEIMA|nr:putative heat shock protein [Leishmania major strain Friedlin]CAC22622.1 putative heat shock protein [Leishmania major strain Friedlin]CAG9567767.1 DnaJ_domain-containing_protein/JDP11/J11 [Leishmania major strain Friedlin]|eukprot:XP_888583.1 putative heat shock protein [Leishmania major strain Friedlin]
MLPRQCSGELYQVLELDAQCTTAEISQQYRRLALRYHPDRNAGATVEQFQRIEEAHRVLSDLRQRQLYDTVGREGLKQLGDYGSGMVGSLLLAVGNVAAGCLLLGFMTASLFIALLISCYKIDAPREWPSWGVVLIPVWCFLPVLLLASLTVMMTSVRRGMYILLLPSVRLLLCVVIATTTAAALDHRIAPLTAFIPWLIWYVLGTVSDLAMLVPTVYSRTHSPLFGEGEDAGVRGNHHTNTSVEDPFLWPGSGHGEASSIDESEATHSSGAEGGFGNDSFLSQPWKTARYWREVAEVLFEAVCVYTFLALAFRRAVQQQAYLGSLHSLPRSRGTAGDSIAAAPPVLSFWVILAPLMTYFGVHVLISVLEGSFMDSTVATTPASPEETPVAQSTSPNAAAPSSSPQQCTHRRRVSCRERVANVILRVFPSACGLYMTCMWAMKGEYEYNKRTSGPDPSAFLAFLPILVVLGALAFLVCCGGCLVMCIGSAVFPAESAAADFAATGGSGASHVSAGRNSRERNYRSTVSRTSPTSGNRSHTHARPSQHAGGTGAATLPSFRGGSATDVAIEQVD